MDITRYNFYETQDEVFESIRQCSFMAIDGEFTGLDAWGYNNNAPFDTVAERYQKLRRGSSDFLLIQFGLCTFKVDPEKQKYEAKPYNFYIFPRPANRYAPDRRFLCQSSSIEFLCAQGFDFNKVFREGIPYLTPDQAGRQKRELDHRHTEALKLANPGLTSPAASKLSRMPVPPEQKGFIDDICAQIDAYLEDEKMSEPLTLSPCNAFQRKLIYQTTEEKYPLLHLETLTGEKKERYIVIHKASNAADRLQKELNKQNIEKMELDIQIGFSKVIECITKSGKLVVGHNMMLDVIHTVNQFQGYLPEDLDGFKAVVNSALPRLLDTKLMASTAPFKEHILSTGLEDLKQTVKDKPFVPVQIDLAEGFDRYKDGEGNFHEAGFDALVTGSCFASMLSLLGQYQADPDPFLLPTSPVVEPFVNKLFLFRIQDIPYMNLAGSDIEPKRPHVFHVTFPSDWKASDLYSLFHPYGNIQISWLTETSALVGLHKKENADLALTGLTSDPNSSFHVITYSSYFKTRQEFLVPSQSLTPHRSRVAPCHQHSPATPNLPSTKTPAGKHKLSEGDNSPPMEKKQKLDNSECSNNPDSTLDQKSISQTTLSDDGDTRGNKDKLFEECSSW